ncbi:oxidoreductase [Flavobacterium sp.]|uniref:sialidase family protein n=1 Tax=Flavobacterium sp. TaxID=239 RepID=UPI002608E537|nr:oxidoreductase [Flavobacterium sp.]MDD2986223.1 oxidoreductase [Flavobacterium sp.]
MRRICEILLLVLLISCKQEEKKINTNKRLPFTGVVSETLFVDSMSVRAISLDNNKVWFATDKGKYGFCRFDKSKNYTNQILFDSIKPHFRGIAQNKASLFLVSTEKPAVIYKVDKNNHSVTKIFEDKNPNAFYNGIQFWNEFEGIAMGDPQNGCLTVVITRDKGQTWEKVDCSNLPKMETGEASFAASNSSLIVKGNLTWILTGGTKARVFYSADKGRNWSAYDTPITQGKPMAGIFSADFYNDSIGIIAGGDYENQHDNSKNKALTINSGQSWSLLADGQGFGYSSCIQFVPECGGILIVSVGPQGIYFSDDIGSFWKKISNDTDLHTLRFIDKKTAIAAGKNKIVKLKFTTD